jgi:hypothetical protein
MAFNSKNLHYDKNEPAFLRKLRGEYRSDGNTFQAARPKRERLTNDDDDAPAMVDEEGASVSKEEYEAMVNGKDDGKASDEKEAVNVAEDGKSEFKGVEEADQKAERQKQKEAEVGVAKKRKQVKVVGDDVEDEDVKKDTKSKPAKKPKKKIKLSFDEPDG